MWGMHIAHVYTCMWRVDFTHVYTCMLHMYPHIAHACGNRRTALGVIPQLPYTLFVETGWLIGLELTKQARGPSASASSVLSLQEAATGLFYVGSGRGTQVFVLI